MDKVTMKPTRDGYGEGLLWLGENRPSVVVLDADLSKSTRTDWFKAKYPQRFFDMGIAEQDMLGTAAGLSLAGKVPFVTTYGVFVAGRAWDQIRTTICYADLNVKIGGNHGGVSVGPDGPTHQALEEIALMRVLPNMRLLVPCDSVEARKATILAAKTDGPVYLRFTREATPVFTPEEQPLEWGKAPMMRDGKDVTIMAAGPILYEALQAADMLAARGISARVLDMVSVKPIDEDAITRAAKETGAIVTAEEHQINAGLGSAIAEVVVKHAPVPMEFIGMKDRFGTTGQPEELAKLFNLTAADIAAAAERAIQRK
jgi:transketolase